jgi:hypothetical protein
LDQSLKQIMSQQPTIRPPRIRSPADDSFKALSAMRSGDKDRDEHVDAK